MCLTTEKRMEMALARRNLEGNGKVACDNARPKSSTSKLRKSPGPAAVYTSRIQSPDQFQKTVVLSSSPPRTHTYSPSDSFTKQQYAGCKWTEPPSPSTLPQPPIHWTQSQPFTFAMPFQNFCQPEQDIAQQLKVLLKVQA